MTAPDQPNPQQPETEAPLPPIQEELAGIATGATTGANQTGNGPTPNGQTAQGHTSKSPQPKRPWEELSWEDLLKQVEAIDSSNVTPKGRAFGAHYRDALNNKFGGTFVIPKLADNAGRTNGGLLVELTNLLHIYDSNDKTSSMFFSHGGSAEISISPKGIFYKPLDPEKNKDAKPSTFTGAEARGIALLAMHNSDLLPPGTMRVTGNALEKAMILKEIDSLNALLPEKARMIVENRDNIEQSLEWQAVTAPQAVVPPAAAAPTPEPTTAAPAPSPSDADDAAPSMEVDGPDDIATATPPVYEVDSQGIAVLRDKVLRQPHGETPIATGEAALELAKKELRAQEQFDAIKQRVKDVASDNIELYFDEVGTTQDGVPVYKNHFTIPGAPGNAVAEVTFTFGDKNEREIISIEKTDFFEGYTSPDIKMAGPKAEPDVLNGAFPGAAEGAKDRTTTNAPMPEQSASDKPNPTGP